MILQLHPCVLSACEKQYIRSTYADYQAIGDLASTLRMAAPEIRSTRRIEREQQRAARRAADAGTPRFSGFRAELEEAKERGRHLPPTGRQG